MVHSWTLNTHRVMIMCMWAKCAILGGSQEAELLKREYFHFLLKSNLNYRVAILDLQFITCFMLNFMETFCSNRMSYGYLNFYLNLTHDSKLSFQQCGSVVMDNFSKDETYLMFQKHSSLIHHN